MSDVMLRAVSPTRRFANTAISTDAGFIIGLAEENVAGWTPVPNESTYADFEVADMRTQELNDKLALSIEDVWSIVASSMELSLAVPRGTWTLRHA